MKPLPNSRLFLFVSLLLIASLACSVLSDLIGEDYGYDEDGYYEDGYYAEEDSYMDDENGIDSNTEDSTPPSGSASAAVGLSCPGVARDILTAATQFTEDPNVESAEEGENIYIVTYAVSGNLIIDPYFEDVSSDLQGYQDDSVSHQKIWEYFITLVPLEERESVLSEFSIVTDGKDNGLAAVAQTTSNPEQWMLEVDIADSVDKQNLTYTLIHEFAHLLTLGPDQVTPSVAIFNNPDDDEIFYDEAAACPVYFPGEGCSQPESYINAYFNQFWADIHAEWQDINLIADDDAYYDALENFYYEYEDHFVTDYAATNPEEDIAEAFTFFVLSPLPAGSTIAEEKILFFYNYPNLVELRDAILGGICELD